MNRKSNEQIIADKMADQEKRMRGIFKTEKKKTDSMRKQIRKSIREIKKIKNIIKQTEGKS